MAQGAGRRPRRGVGSAARGLRAGPRHRAGRAPRRPRGQDRGAHLRCRGRSRGRGARDAAADGARHQRRRATSWPRSPRSGCGRAGRSSPARLAAVFGLARGAGGRGAPRPGRGGSGRRRPAPVRQRCGAGLRPAEPREPAAARALPGPAPGRSGAGRTAAPVPRPAAGAGRGRRKGRRRPRAPAVRPRAPVRVRPARPSVGGGGAAGAHRWLPCRAARRARGQLGPRVVRLRAAADRRRVSRGLRAVPRPRDARRSGDCRRRGARPHLPRPLGPLRVLGSRRFLARAFGGALRPAVGPRLDRRGVERLVRRPAAGDPGPVPGGAPRHGRGGPWRASAARTESGVHALAVEPPRGRAVVPDRTGVGRRGRHGCRGCRGRRGRRGRRGATEPDPASTSSISRS